MASFMRSLSPSTNPIFDFIRGRFRGHFLDKFQRTPSPILSRKISQSTSTSPECPSNLSPFPELNSRIVDLYPSLHRTEIVIRSTFHDSTHVSVGVCFEPALALTSAHVVGRAAANKAYIGSLCGCTAVGFAPVKLVPIAINFAADVAVLKIEELGEAAALDVCKVADSPPQKENIIMSVSIDVERGWALSLGNVQAVGKKTIRAKAPWPLKDELAWIEHDWLVFNRGPPPPLSVLFTLKEIVTGSVTRISGSPWFNLYGEVVGVASWVLRDDPVGFSVGYVAPMSNILPVVEYAKIKRPDDPTVMDRWIDNEVVIVCDQQES